MNDPKLLQQMIGVTLVVLFLVGCGAPTAAPTPTHVVIAVTATPQPTATPVPPTATLTPTQPPTEIQPAEPQVTETQSVKVQATETQPTEVPPSETQPTEVAPIVILQGQFKDADSVHKGSGTATIYQRPDGSYLLSFENFAVCCSPDLYVFLASNPSPAGHADLGDYLELSSLKASTGDQDYEIPADTDLSQIKSVVIYCKPFQVIISTATLS